MIHVQDCAGYDLDEVRAAVGAALQALGGVEALVPEGARVLVKPNLLMGKPAEAAVTTHPAVVQAVLETLRARTDRILVGDSPGLGTAPGVAQACGVAEACARLGVPVVDFARPVRLRAPAGCTFPAFDVAREAAEADLIVNLPKLKTHGMVRLTCAVKNMFGCIVKEGKPQWHFRAGRDAAAFAAMLVDLHEALRPALTIADAVAAMEGQGPSRGRVRSVGLLIAGDCAHEVDAACARLAGFDPAGVPTLAVARRRGLLSAEAERAAAALRPLDPPFAEPRPADAAFGMPGLLSAFMHRYLTSRPVVIKDLCRRCLECRRICPAGAISAPHGRPRVSEARCIRCYCCHEICPHGAMDLRAGLVLRTYARLPHHRILPAGSPRRPCIRRTANAKPPEGRPPTAP